MGNTDHYGLKRLGAGEAFSDDGYKYTDADRVLIDRLLYLGAEGHRHSGDAAVAPTLGAVALTSSALSGSLPAGTRAYYKYTLVDVNGFESAASVEAYVDTEAAIVEPAAPVLVVNSLGGSLLPGQYFYVLSAYTLVNTNETKALNPSYYTVPAGTSTNTITLNLPTLPGGATGWNIYRKRPGGARYDYLASTTSVTTYVDNGSVVEDCNRTLPVRNTTNSTNSVTATIGTVPVGSTWKLYRTYSAGYYDGSLVHHVVEETSEGSGIVTPSYVDMGLATLAGKPPVASQVVGGPDPVGLQDMAEVEGQLPMAAVSGFPYIAEFRVSGALSAATGTAVWVSEFPRASIRGVRASLGRGYAPASQPVIVDVNVGRGANPVMASIFATSGDQPRVLAGSQRGTRVVPTARTELVEGDVLTIDIDQAGGGATPTDRDLIVQLYMWVYGFTSLTSFIYPSTPFTPLQLPGLVAWYKADAITGLVDTNALTTWTDSSSSGHDATQATAASKPLYRTNILNGKPVVRFDGTNDFLKTAVFAALLDQPTTVFAVVKSSVTTGTHAYLSGFAAGGEIDLYKLSNPAYHMSAGWSLLSTTPVDTAFHIIAATYDDADSVIRVGGGPGTTGIAGGAPAAGLTLGAFPDGSANFLQGDEAEILVFNADLTVADLNAVGAYLASKYALTWTTVV